MKKRRSTNDGRVHNYERFCELLDRIPTLTDEQLLEEIKNVLHFSVLRSDKDTRESLILTLVKHRAKLIVDA